MELGDILGSIRRHWRVSVGIMAAAVVLLVAFLVTREQVQPPRRIEATVQILIPARDPDGLRPPGVPPVLLQGQTSLALNPSTRTAALDGADLSVEDRDDVRLSARLNETFDIMTVSATAGDLETARAAADSFANAYVAARRETVAITSASSQRNARISLETLNDRLDTVEDELRADGVDLPDVVVENDDPEGTETPVQIDVGSGLSLDNELKLYTRNSLINEIRRTRETFAELGVEALTPRSYSDIVERPQPRTITPEPPSPLIPIAIALGLGLVLALAVPVLMDRFDHTIKDAKTATSTLGAPVLAAIPAWPKSAEQSVADPGTELDLAFRSLAATSVATDRLPRTLLVSSPAGTTQDTVAAGFAVALAEIGVRVVLVGTSTRHAWYAGSATADRLEGHRFPDLLQRAHRGELDGGVLDALASDEVANLFVVAPGEDDDLILSLDGLPPLLSALSNERTDVVIVAGPPFLEDPNATIFSWTIRNVLWTIRTGEVTDAQAREVASRLELAGVSPFGLALIGRES